MIPACVRKDCEGSICPQAVLSRTLPKGIIGEEEREAYVTAYEALKARARATFARRWVWACCLQQAIQSH